MKLKGNELGWILKLAEIGFEKESFKKFREKNPKLEKFLIQLLLRFHPNHFHAGFPNVTWELKKIE
jgi:hypothetical protein